MYNLVIVGAGFTGAVLAEKAATAGMKVLLLDKRPHIGGNSWSEIDPETGIEEHVYGSHIFHTSNEEVWKYISRFADFNDYRHSVYTVYKDKMYSLPINLGTINSFFDINLKPFEAKKFIESEIAKEKIAAPSNLEDKAISLIGRGLYEAFVKGYTIKQWERDPKELSEKIITRLPVRYNYNIRYFQDKYEGIPINGYAALFKEMLSHENITVKLNTDYFDLKNDLDGIPLVFTGPMDRFFDYKHGKLGWRTVIFDRELIAEPDYQGATVVNYAEEHVPWTRIHEFKHYHPERKKCSTTLIYKEFSHTSSESDDPYYPVNTQENREIMEKYLEEAAALKNIWFAGRLGLYQYLDMDDAIEGAFKIFNKIQKELVDNA